jgi:hypothetical protein
MRGAGSYNCSSERSAHFGALFRVQADRPKGAVRVFQKLKFNVRIAMPAWTHTIIKGSFAAVAVLCLISAAQPQSTATPEPPPPASTPQSSTATQPQLPASTPLPSLPRLEPSPSGSTPQPTTAAQPQTPDSAPQPQRQSTGSSQLRLPDQVFSPAKELFEKLWESIKLNVYEVFFAVVSAV